MDFIPLRRSPSPWPRPGATRAWNARRLAAARRAVAREAEAVPLFPELRRYQTVEERVAERGQDEADLHQRMRAGRATAWRQARARLAALPLVTQAGVRRYWAECGSPADPSYLLSLIRDVTHRHRSPWRSLRILHLLRRRRLPPDYEY